MLGWRKDQGPQGENVETITDEIMMRVEKTLSAFYKAAGIGNDPGNPRQDGVPVGMRVSSSLKYLMQMRIGSDYLLTRQNLGATCYVNSFLQVRAIERLYFDACD